jgi:quinoprotein glucose dehydrogenase
MIAGILIMAAAAAAGDWAYYGADAGGSRYSALTQIDRGNVARLEVAWVFHSGDMETKSDAMKWSALEVTPIHVRDKLFTCTPFNRVIALDPGTGSELWEFDARIATDYRPANQFVCRGVSYWEDSKTSGPCAARIFMGTNDTRLFALDADTGQRCADFGDNGEVKIDAGMSLLWPGEFQITSSPAVIRDVVIVGSAIGDNARADSPRGTVRAFDARTGALRWKFEPIPLQPPAGLESSWQNGSAAHTGQANVWSTMSVDAERDLVFMPTSSASPDFFGGERPGDNRYANSVVAVRGSTGEVVWHFQTVHHDIWDYDVAAQPNLLMLQVEGADAPVPAVIQAT